MPKNHKPGKISAGNNNRYFSSRKKESVGGADKCPVSPGGSHWWKIETPNPPPAGKSSKGACQFCGSTRKFWNTLEAAAENGCLLIPLLVKDDEDEEEGMVPGLAFMEGGAY